MNRVAVLVMIAFTAFMGKLEAKRPVTSPSLAEVTRYEQAILNKAKGQSTREWYGGQSDALIPQDAVASVSELSCTKMPQYESAKSPNKMWLCKYDLEIKTRGKVLLKDHQSQQLSQDIRLRTLEIPPPQVVLPK